MVLNRIVITSYIVYILYYTIIDVNWGIGIVICKYCDKQLTSTRLFIGFSFLKYEFILNDLIINPLKLITDY